MSTHMEDLGLEERGKVNFSRRMDLNFEGSQPLLVKI